MEEIKCMRSRWGFLVILVLGEVVWKVCEEVSRRSLVGGVWLKNVLTENMRRGDPEVDLVQSLTKER